MKSQNRTLSLFLGILAAFVSLSCGEETKKVYLLEETRVVAMQFLKDPGGTTSTSGCAADAYVQQFPLRPGDNMFLRIVVLSPEGDDPAFQLTGVTQFVGVGARSGARGPDRLDNVTASVQNLFQFTEAPTLACVRQTTPIVVKEFVYTFTVPGIDKLTQVFAQSGGIPYFTLNYKGTGKSRTDTGFLTFPVFPNPGDDGVWNSLKTNGATDVEIALLKKQAQTNTPPKIESIDVANPALSSGSENDIEVKIAGDDNDEGAKSRVQWYVSKGKINNVRSAKIKWKPDFAGKVSAVAVVRDLQGGVDFKLKTVDSN
jgi:hypothetical protein